MLWPPGAFSVASLLRFFGNPWIDAGEFAGKLTLILRVASKVMQLAATAAFGSTSNDLMGRSPVVARQC